MATNKAGYVSATLVRIREEITVYPCHHWVPKEL